MTNKRRKDIQCVIQAKRNHAEERNRQKQGRQMQNQAKLDATERRVNVGTYRVAAQVESERGWGERGMPLAAEEGEDILGETDLVAGAATLCGRRRGVGRGRGRGRRGTDSVEGKPARKHGWRADRRLERERRDETRRQKESRRDAERKTETNGQSSLEPFAAVYPFPGRTSIRVTTMEKRMYKVHASYGLRLLSFGRGTVRAGR
jgi:hypothetical protein